MVAHDNWTPEGRQSSSGTRVLIILLGVGAGFILLCCGGAFYFFSTHIKQYRNDPEATAAIAREIADIDVPEPFQPRHAMVMDVLVTKMKAAFYERQDGEGLLMIAETADSDSADGSFDVQDLLDRQDRSRRALQTIRSESRTFAIKGKEVRFLFTESKDEEGNPFREVTGSFPGKQGAAFLHLLVEADKYDEHAIVKMIESIGRTNRKPEDAGPPNDE